MLICVGAIGDLTVIFTYHICKILTELCDKFLYQLCDDPVNGTLPAPENVLSGRYTLVKTLSFVFLKDKLSVEAKAFLDFVRSKEGRKILEANGYLSVE